MLKQKNVANMDVSANTLQWPQNPLYMCSIRQHKTNLYHHSVHSEHPTLLLPIYPSITTYPARITVSLSPSLRLWKKVALWTGRWSSVDTDTFYLWYTKNTRDIKPGIGIAANLESPIKLTCPKWTNDLFIAKFYQLNEMMNSWATAKSEFCEMRMTFDEWSINLLKKILLIVLNIMNVSMSLTCFWFPGE